MSRADEAKTEKRLGRPRNEVDPEMLARIAKQGVSMEGVADIFQVSVSTIRRNYLEHFERGKGNCASGLRTALINRAMTPTMFGSTSALIFACKSIAGLSEDGPRPDEEDERKPRGALIQIHSVCDRCRRNMSYDHLPAGARADAIRRDGLDPADFNFDDDPPDPTN